MRGELDEKTRQAFEIHYLEHPETLEELRLIEAMREGMTALDEKSKVTTLRPTFTARSPFIPYATAASMGFLVLVISGMWHERYSLKQELYTLKQEHTKLTEKLDAGPRGVQVIPGTSKALTYQRSADEGDASEAYTQRTSKRFLQITYIDDPRASTVIEPKPLSGGESLYEFTLNRVDSDGRLTFLFSKSSILLPSTIRIPMYQTPPGFYQYRLSTVDGLREKVGYINVPL